MAKKISRFITDGTPTLRDKVIGSEVGNSSQTMNYEITYLKELGFFAPYIQKSADYKIETWDTSIEGIGDTSLAFRLPSAVDVKGKPFTILSSVAGGLISLNPILNQTINGESAVYIGHNGWITIKSNGTNWKVIERSDHEFILNVTVGAADNFILPFFEGGDYDALVDWGDGTSDRITSGTQAEIDHDYTTAGAGTYTITVSGKFIGFATNYDYTGVQSKLTEVRQWGNLLLNSQRGFFNCGNITITATDILDIHGETNLEGMFLFCSSITTIPSLQQWDFSNVENLNATFGYCTLFDQPVAGIDISSCTNLTYTFAAQATWNHPVNDLDVSNVTQFAGTFFNMGAFNQPIDQWDTSKGTTFLFFLASAVSFNQPVNSLNLSSGVRFTQMFANATVFNQPVDDLDVSNGQDFIGMFSGLPSFDQSLDRLDVSNATNMDGFLAFSTGISQTNVGEMLVGFAALPSLQPNITLGLEGQVLTTGPSFAYAIARGELEGPPNFWTISL